VANPLSPFLKERLRLSAITPEAARYAGIQAMTVPAARAAGYELPGYPQDGFLLPYYNEAGKLISEMWRWRNDTKNKKWRYVQPAGTGCRVYFPRVKGLDWRRVLADPKIPVFIVEGELKALSLTLAGVPAVALGGVWNYLTHKALLPELKQLAEGGRPTWIAFDSDTEDKSEVKRARYNLARALLDEHAEVHWLTLPHLADPDSPDKTGVDDLVRVSKSRDDKLRSRLTGLEETDRFAIQQHLYRMNAEYVFNRANARVYEVANPAQSWDDLKFARVIEPAPVVVSQKIGKGGKLEDVVGKLGRAWLEWPGHNLVKGQVYELQPQDAERSPYVTLDGQRYLNNWTGWASDPEPDPEGVAKYWTALLDHLFRKQHAETEAEKQERERARRWLEMWFAYPVQHPAAKLYSCAAILGAQGGGKTLLGNMVGWACYGRHFTDITQDQLDSRFTGSWAANRSFVMGSEVTSVADYRLQRKVSEMLKNWITGEEFDIEHKNIPSYKVRNVLNLYFTANQDDAFFLEDDDRRYFVYKIPDVKLTVAFGQPWVRAMDNYIRSPKGQAALHYHLLYEVKIDPKLFDPKGSPPITEAKRNAKEDSKNTAEHWLDKFAEAPEEYTDRPRGQKVFRVEEVHEAFLKSTNLEERKWSEQAFLRAMRKKFQNLGRKKVRIYIGNARDWTTKTYKPKFETKKTGLWMRKPSYENGGGEHFTTLAEAGTIWAKQTAQYLLERKNGLPTSNGLVVGLVTPNPPGRVKAARGAEFGGKTGAD
jgi:hypothetical protein